MDPAQVATGRLILLIVAATYPLSAVLLTWLRYRGESVPWVWPAAWLVTGIAGLVLAATLRTDTPAWAWWGLLVALAPIMIVSTVVDVRHGYWVIVGLDVLGLLAIGYALWLLRGLAF